MNIEESILQFTGYQVIKAEYSVNDIETNAGDKYVIKPIYDRMIRKLGNNEYALFLEVRVGDGDEPFPFRADVGIVGKFRYSSVDHDETLLKKNAVAILFPYLRSTLTMLTSLANVNPIILPTINLVKMFEDNEANEMIDSQYDRTSK